MIDTHCHLTFDGLYEQVDEVVRRAAAADVRRMVTVGTTPDDARRAVATSERFEGVFCTVGIHPHYAGDGHEKTAVVGTMRELAAHRHIVAFGEMGLDKHYPDPPIETQRTVLNWQLEVAAELEHLPIIIHNRETTEDTLGLLKASGIPGRRFVFHCFTGSDEELEAVLEFGAMVSFTGIVTFRNAKALARCATRVPIGRLMIETDAPYLTPEPFRKVRTNEPCYLPFTARFLAAQRGMEQARLVEVVDANADRFFGLAGL